MNRTWSAGICGDDLKIIAHLEVLASTKEDATAVAKEYAIAHHVYLTYVRLANPVGKIVAVVPV